MRHSFQRVFVLTIATISSGIAMSSSAHDVRYWVWQRDDPLDEQELRELVAQKIDTIYWQAGELENIGANWRWKALFNFSSSGWFRASINRFPTHPSRRCSPVCLL